MRTTFTVMLISLFCSIYLSCSPYAVQIDYDRRIDFPGIKPISILNR
jgi:hypothetical protein